MATDTQVNISREAPEIEAIRMQLLEAAKAQTEAPLQLPGFQVAGFTPEQAQALQLGVQGIGAYRPFMQQATQAVGQGISGLGGTTGRYDPTMGQAFMNPYQQQVIDESLRQIQRQGDISRQNLQAQAVRAGAFGGSREGIQRAELESGLAQQQNAAIISALQQGYGQSQDQAQRAFEAQQGRQLQASQLYGQLGQGIGALGQAQQQLGQQDTSFLFGLGQQQQRQQQAVLDAQRATAMQSAMQPMQNIAFLSDIYRGAPSTQMSMTQQASPTPSPFQQLAGTAVGIGATAKAFSI
jgi:hypothetical protein